MPRKGRARKKVTKVPKLKREYYENEIADLLRQISVEQSKKRVIDEKNHSLEAAYASAIGDRNDITEFINRSMDENDVNNKNLEKQIMKHESDRASDTADFQRQLKIATDRYKSTHIELSSEVKYLTGLYHSHADLRQQKDDILGRLDRAELNLDVAQQRHRSELYEAERSSIVAAELQNRAINAKIDEMRDMKRIQGYKNVMLTQHFIRENVVLNNELDRRLFVHRRLCDEHNYAKQNLQKGGYELVVSEIEDLRKLMEVRRGIISRMQHNMRKLKREYYQRSEQKNLAIAASTRQTNMTDQCDALHRQIAILNYDVLRTYASGQNQSRLLTQQSQEMHRIAGKFVVMSREISGAMDVESLNGFDAKARKKLLADLMVMAKEMDCQKSPEPDVSTECIVVESRKVETTLFEGYDHKSEFSMFSPLTAIDEHDYSESVPKISPSKLQDFSSGSELVLSDPFSSEIAPSDFAIESEEDLGVSSSD